MRIGVPREPVDQPRTAASPQTVELMIRLGYEVLVERGAGGRA
ncbi:alanine dehydrogenase/PNT, N-terminal domain protein, partial [Actinomyces naeslundii str. Howell 279]